MRTVRDSGGKPVTVEKIATRGKNAGKKITTALREPVLGRDGKVKTAE